MLDPSKNLISNAIIFSPSLLDHATAVSCTSYMYSYELVSSLQVSDPFSVRVWEVDDQKEVEVDRKGS
jgi:hypothetical protein